MRRISSPGRRAGLLQRSNKQTHLPQRSTDNRSAMHVRTPALLLIALLLVACSGCIALEKDDGPDPAEPPWSGAAQPSPDKTAPAPPSTGSRNTVVPVDPVPVQPGEHLPNPNTANVTPIPMTRIDTTRPVAEKTKVFEEQYTLYHSARGLQVDVVDVPFIITFSATPRHPEPDANSRLVVTVRDPETLRLIADEGYHGIYGSAREKSITLYRAGRYIVTLDGRFVDVKVTMGTEKMNVPG
ncbi:hypothetical protein [Methanoculleus chikugoensis]|uniref:hypothetical protein n=1 Tax=Methanoculleus chikugoensis TaxID=118126 RepID=UPI001C80CFD0|nr:hypothetical protein [Methanoculleus chikugoensis]